MVPIRENLLSSAKYDLKVPVESCAKDMKYIVVHNTRRTMLPPRMKSHT